MPGGFQGVTKPAGIGTPIGATGMMGSAPLNAAASGAAGRAWGGIMLGASGPVGSGHGAPALPRGGRVRHEQRTIESSAAAEQPARSAGRRSSGAGVRAAQRRGPLPDALGLFGGSKPLIPSGMHHRNTCRGSVVEPDISSGRLTRKLF